MRDCAPPAAAQMLMPVPQRDEDVPPPMRVMIE